MLTNHRRLLSVPSWPGKCHMNSTTLSTTVGASCCVYSLRMLNSGRNPVKFTTKLSHLYDTSVIVLESIADGKAISINKTWLHFGSEYCHFHTWFSPFRLPSALRGLVAHHPLIRPFKDVGFWILWKASHVDFPTFRILVLGDELTKHGAN